MLLLWPAIFHSLISACLAVLVNVTIDDTLGDSENGRHITYLPPAQWNSSPTCDACTTTSHLDRNRTHDGTWHEGIANKSPEDSPPLLASVQFYGSAIYVYCIIANTKDEKMDLTFLIDSQRAGIFKREPVGAGTFQYNTLVFSYQTMAQDNHTLTIQNGHVGGDRSLTLLDYIVYTYDNGLPAPSASGAAPIPAASGSSEATISPSNTGSSQVNSSGKIVGGVLGTIGVILIAFVVFLWHRQQNLKNGSVDLSRSPVPPPKDTPVNPVSWVRGWWHSPSSGTRSRFSFNPSLLVEPMMMNRNYPGSSHLRRPPPVTTVLPVHPPPQRPDSTRPLQPNREATPTPSLDARNEQSQPLSIVEWQRRTQREADDVPPRFDVSDVDMSSYYDFSSDTPELSQPQQPRPRSTPRRFTVVNV